jgi:DNA replication protein DnaC
MTYNYRIIDGERVAIFNEPDQIKKVYDAKLKNSGIPENYWDIEFTDYKGEKSITEYKQIVRYAYAAKDEKFHNINLYLYGDFRNQKTMLACNIGKQFIKDGFSVQFVTAGNLTNIFLKNQSFNKDEATFYKLNKYNLCDLLIIDDAFDRNKSLLWGGDNKGMIISEWDRLIRDRIACDKRTIITSNVSPQNIMSTYSQAIYELIDSEYLKMKLLDTIKEERKSRFEGLFDE